MIRPGRPDDEGRRQATLDAYRILDSPPETAYDDLVRIASAVCDTPMAVVSLVDRDRQWFKARVGVDAEETTRDESFCAHAILTPDVTTVVPDTLRDPRFHDHPLVTGDAGVRFYAGAPLRAADGAALGTVCVLDRRPRHLTAEMRAALEAGVPVAGICLYPVVDYPGWTNGRHCQVGLLGFPDSLGRRPVHAPLADELLTQQLRFGTVQNYRAEESAR